MMTRWKLPALVAASYLALIAGACAKDPAIVKQRHLEKAQGYYAKSQYNEATIELKNALQIDPKFPPAAHLIGRAYAAKAWHLDAARELRRAVELEPDNLEAHIDLGRASVAIEAWGDVLREATALADKDPANAWALYFQAAALNAKGQRQDALAAIDKALAGGQSSSEFQTLRGDILNGLEQFGEAEPAYRAALACSDGRTGRTRRAVFSNRPRPTTRPTRRSAWP
jgi:Tfp pilus assembly protein PilF